jgi:small subunit ribosomal protein S19e
MSMYEIPAAEYNKKLAAKLKEMEEFKMPEWALFVKTGISKVRPPESVDYWYNRAASMLRQIYKRGILGVNRMRTKYGSKKNRGMKPEIFMKSSGKIIRTILQQAEKAGLVEKVTEGKRFGRRLTRKGKEFLETIK